MRAHLSAFALGWLLASPMAMAEVVPGSGSGPARPGTPEWFSRLNGLGPQVFECWDAESLSPLARALTVQVKVRFSPGGNPENIELYASDGGGEPAASSEAYEAARRAILACGTEGYDLSPVDWRPTVFAVFRFEAPKRRLDVSNWGYE